MMNKCCIKGCQSSYYTAVSKENVKSVFKVSEDVSISILWKMFVMIESLRVEQLSSFALTIAKSTPYCKFLYGFQHGIAWESMGIHGNA